MEGIFLGQDILSQGSKKNKDTGEDEPWMLYKYNIDKKFCSGFVNQSSFMGKYVIVTYKESPNPKNANSPYKNVVNIVEGIDKKDTTDTTKQANVAEPVAQQNAPDWDKINSEKQQAILFGMCSNQAVQLIIGKDGDYKASFSEVFDTVWEENIKKRKEKLNY